MMYIVCNTKKSKPKVSIELCEKCKRMRFCADYGNYIQPSLFPEITEKTHRRRQQQRSIKSATTETQNREHQLAMEIPKRESASIRTPKMDVIQKRAKREDSKRKMIEMFETCLKIIKKKG